MHTQQCIMTGNKLYINYVLYILSALVNQLHDFINLWKLVFRSKKHTNTYTTMYMYPLLVLRALK